MNFTYRDLDKSGGKPSDYISGRIQESLSYASKIDAERQAIHLDRGGHKVQSIMKYNEKYYVYYS
jgi:hypothetical protein